MNLPFTYLMYAGMTIPMFQVSASKCYVMLWIQQSLPYNWMAAAVLWLHHPSRAVYCSCLVGAMINHLTLCVTHTPPDSGLCRRNSFATAFRLIIDPKQDETNQLLHYPLSRLNNRERNIAKTNLPVLPEA